MEGRIQTVCVILLAVVAAGFALYWLKPVMIPFVLALFITVGLSAFVDLAQRRLHLPRLAALAVTAVGGVLFLFLVASLVSASVAELTRKASVYQEQCARMIERGIALLPFEDAMPAYERGVQQVFGVSEGVLRDMILTTTTAIVDVLSNSVLVFIFVVFLLVGSKAAHKPRGHTWRQIEARVKRYIAAKVVLSAATGFLVGLTLRLLGVDLALAFGLFAFLLNFIPNVGSIVATLLPLPIVLFSPDVTTAAGVAAFVVPGALQLTIGNFVEPKVMGQSLDIHPVVILMAIIFWGMLWGIPGALLATPITAVMKILFERLPSTRPLAEIMAGRLDAVHLG